LFASAPEPSSRSYFATQVLDLGVTRALVRRLVQVFPHVCADCNPLLHTPSAVYRVVNTRIRELNRRSKASRAAPGYVHESTPRVFSALLPVDIAVPLE